MAAPRRALAVLAVALLCAQAAHARQLMQTKYGGANLYDCLSRIPWLSTTKLSIDQAGTDVQNLFKNPLLEITFFAPDNQNWVTLGQYQQPPQTVSQMLADKPFTATVLRNHVAEAIIPTQNWPTQLGADKGYTTASAGGTQLTRWVDGKYTWRMAGWVGYNQLGSQYTNLQCGSSILHLVCDAWDSKPPPSG